MAVPLVEEVLTPRKPIFVSSLIRYFLTFLTNWIKGFKIKLRIFDLFPQP